MTLRTNCRRAKYIKTLAIAADIMNLRYARTFTLARCFVYACITLRLAKWTGTGANFKFSSCQLSHACSPSSIIDALGSEKNAHFRP